MKTKTCHGSHSRGLLGGPAPTKLPGSTRSGSTEALVATIPSRARVLSFANLPPDTLAASLAASHEQAAWAAAASHGRLARARALLGDEAVRTRRSATLDLVEGLARGQASEALAAAAAVVALADDVAAASKARQARELAELDETYGSGRGTGAMRKRLETRHRRELRRARFDAIREALADLLGAYRDMALLRAGGPRDRLVHSDRAVTFERLAAAADPAAAVRAAAALEEADRRLAIGAAPLLTLEAAFLSVQAAFAGPRVPMGRLEIRR